MSWGVDSYGFMQLSPFVRCNSHWVRDFFPVDDAETLKDANRTGAYKYQKIVKILPNYTERELSERELLQRRGVFDWSELLTDAYGDDGEYVNWHWVRHEIEEDAEERKKELATWRKSKSSRARYKPDGVRVFPPMPWPPVKPSPPVKRKPSRPVKPKPFFGDGKTSWRKANPDTWDHLTFQDTELVRQLANPSKHDPPQVKKLIEEIKGELKAEMTKAYQPPEVAQVWKNFFSALEEIAPLREKLKEITYEI
jgi:hypothetical protein